MFPAASTISLFDASRHVRLNSGQAHLPGADGHPITAEGGELESDLVSDHRGEGVPEYAAAIDGIESLVLAQYCAGIETQTEMFARAIETAVDMISHRAVSFPGLPVPVTVVFDPDDECGIRIEGSSAACSERDDSCLDENDEDADYCAALSGFEALVWAQYTLGMDVQADNYKEALFTAMEALSNNY